LIERFSANAALLSNLLNQRRRDQLWLILTVRTQWFQISQRREENCE